MFDTKRIDALETRGYVSSNSQNVYGSAAVTHFTYLCKHGQEIVEKFLSEHGS